MPIKFNYTLTQTATLISVLTPVVALLFYLTSVIATKNQVAVVRNDAAIANNETHIALMYLKYPAVQLESWTVEDRAKFEQLQEFKKSFEITRKKLSGIPDGLPQ